MQSVVVPIPEQETMPSTSERARGGDSGRLFLKVPKVAPSSASRLARVKWFGCHAGGGQPRHDVAVLTVERLADGQREVQAHVLRAQGDSEWTAKRCRAWNEG